MADLSVLIVLPKPLKNAETTRQVEMNIATVAMVLGMEDIKIKHRFVNPDTLDTALYDAEGNFIINPGDMEVDQHRWSAAADQVAAEPKRKTYVVFMCTGLVDRVGPRLEPRRSNGVSGIGLAVSMLPFMAPKKMVGDRDAQTWAHEIGHGLGLEHIETEGTENLMHPMRHADGNAAGWTLTKGQLATMREHCDRLND